jgi:phosphopantothenoylcysteine synthetase/decarboxylase
MAASLSVADPNKKKTQNVSILSVSPPQKQEQCLRDKSNQQYLEKDQQVMLVLNRLTLKQLSRKKLAQKIKDDVINWSKNVLEPMNKHLGFPACPFAAKWRRDNKLRIEVRPDKTKYEKHLTSLLKDWNKKQHDIIIFCDPYWDQYDNEQFQDKIDFYNKTYNKRDVYFMGFHPTNPATVDEQEFLVNTTSDRDWETSLLL